MFASPSTLAFNAPSRKDDLISVCYIVIFLLNGCCLPFENKIKQTSSTDLKKNIKISLDFKTKYPLTAMVQELGLSFESKKLLTQFVNLVEDLEYEEEPFYDQIKWTLDKV